MITDGKSQMITDIFICDYLLLNLCQSVLAERSEAIWNL